jgi:hypothetical protein
LLFVLTKSQVRASRSTLISFSTEYTSDADVRTKH